MIRKYPRQLLLCISLSITVYFASLVSGVAGASTQHVHNSSQYLVDQKTASDRCRTSLSDEAIAMVQNAESLIDELGQQKALPKFMDPKSGFIKDDLYVFVLDDTGVVLANGAFPFIVGSSVLESHDQLGKYFIKEMLNIAEDKGSGWVSYRWVNPCTQKLTLKQTYFKKVGQLVVCVGIYDAVVVSRSALRNTLRTMFAILVCTQRHFFK